MVATRSGRLFQGERVADEGASARLTAAFSLRIRQNRVCFKTHLEADSVCCCGFESYYHVHGTLRTANLARFQRGPSGRSVSLYRKTVLATRSCRFGRDPFVRSVSVGLWVDTVLATNPLPQRHLAFRRTHGIQGPSSEVLRDRPKPRIVGGYLNAFTGKETHVLLRRALDETLPLALDVNLRLLLHATFRPRSWRRERRRHRRVEECRRRPRRHYS